MTVPTSGREIERLDDAGAPVGRGREGSRLVWAAAGAGSRLDGAWWPRTRNATAELMALVPLVSEHLGVPVRRVSASIAGWDTDQPRRLRCGDGLVRVGWFRTLEPCTVTLGRSGEDRVTLLVLPPALTPAAGDSLLRRLSASAHWPDSATSALSSTRTAESVRGDQTEDTS